MKIIKYAKYVGIMIGTVEKSFSEPNKLTLPQKVWSRDCVTSRSMSSLFFFGGSCPRQTKLLSMLRPMPYSILPQDHTMPFPSDMRWLCVWPWARLAWDPHSQPRGPLSSYLRFVP